MFQATQKSLGDLSHFLGGFRRAFFRGYIVSQKMWMIHKKCGWTGELYWNRYKQWKMTIKLMIKYSIRPEIDLRVGATIIDIITLGRLTEIDLSQLSKVQSRNLKKENLQYSNQHLVLWMCFIPRWKDEPSAAKLRGKPPIRTQFVFVIMAGLGGWCVWKGRAPPAKSEETNERTNEWTIFLHFNLPPPI